MDKSKYIEIRNKLSLERDPWSLPIYVLQDLLLIAGVVLGWNLFHHSWSRFLVIPLMVTLIFRGFSLMHDAVHRAVTQKRFLNELVGVIAGGICFLPYEHWKRGHLEHHLWAGNIDKDPVTALITAYPKMSRAMQGTLSFFWSSWLPILGVMQHMVFWWLSAKVYSKEPRSFKLAVSLLSPIVIWTGLFTLCPTDFVLTALAPALVLYLIVVEVVNLPHHLQLPQYRGNTKFPFWEQHKVARTCLYPKWFARFVVLNFNYHIEHHMYPDVPWYHLDKLHSEVSLALKGAQNTDPNFKWILENKPKPIAAVLSPVFSPPDEVGDSHNLVA